MTVLEVARNHYAARQRLVQAAAEAGADLWRSVNTGSITASWQRLVPTLLVVVTGAQRASAQLADRYVDAALTEQGAQTTAEGRVAVAALAGVASDGRPLDTLLQRPAFGALFALSAGHPLERALAMGQASLDMIVRTQVADAGRVADQLALVARRTATGYVRMLNAPSCSRCAILAGRRYVYNAGFQRHPRCRSNPVTVYTFRQLRTGPTTCAPTHAATSTRCRLRSRIGCSPPRARRRSATAPTCRRWSTPAVAWPPLAPPVRVRPVPVWPVSGYVAHRG